MAQTDPGVFLSVFIIVLTILAIVVYIFFYASAAWLFYAIFIVAVIVMLYTWNRMSRTPAPTQMPAKRATRQGSRKRRRSR